MDGDIRTVLSSIANMVLLVLLIALPLCWAEWPCPFGAMKYTSPDGMTRQCYIALHFQEIKFVRMYLWNEGKRTSYWNRDGRNRVESYPDAVRLCAMVPFIRNIRGEGWLTYFKPEWRRIPDYFDLRLPTPTTRDHLNWLRSRMLITPYVGQGAILLHRDYGRMWLGIKKSSSTLVWEPKQQCEHLTRASVQGDCGYFAEAPNAALVCQFTGLYWLQCDDKEIGPYSEGIFHNANTMVANDVVSCEFDAPDCIQQRIANMCAYSVQQDACLQVDVYTTVKQVHPLFGEPCKLNGTFTSEPCPPEHTGQCRRDCVWAEWQTIGPCYVMIDGRRYVCDEEDEYGEMDRWRNVSVRPKYGGGCRGRQLSTISCVCGAERATAGLAIALLIAQWL